MLDEPERHLDVDWVGFLVGQLRGLADKGATVLVASHSSVVLGECNEIVELT